jgi:acyl-CoA synthetase (AMP-forming)/AMP-acid ligase II
MNKRESSCFTLLDDRYVSSGPVLPGTQVRLVERDAHPGENAKTGEIQIFGDSLFYGYWGKRGFQNQSMTSDGWYATGDYGLLVGNELFVIGRTKDIVIVGGVNILPDEIETLVNSVTGLYAGRVVAFGVDDQAHGTESLVVVAEMRGEYEACAASGLELEIRRMVSSVLAIAPRYVRVVPERWIVKSTSGKISRTETRKRFLREMEKASQRNLVGMDR